MKNKVIIGIDPGTYCTGYGILEINNCFKKKIIYLSSGCIISKSNLFSVRLYKIYKSIYDIFSLFKPNELIIEKSFLCNNLNVSFKLNQINAVIILAAVNFLIPVYEYNINYIRKYISKKSLVSKYHVNCYVRKFLNINESLDFNISDALAIAIVHVIK